MKQSWKKRWAWIVAAMVFLLPLWMWLLWLLTPRTSLPILILDKTVLDKKGQEHRSLNWVLLHQKWSKPDGSFYRIDRDYYGFFPQPDHTYEIYDLKGYSQAELDSLAEANQVAYFTDTYGIYLREWKRRHPDTERSLLIYGGTTHTEVDLLEKMKARNKLILLEFNSFALPTAAAVRRRVEDAFGVHWSGWTGRYFTVLDTSKNPELPRWIVRSYLRQHHNQWPFTRGGIVLVHRDETIAILEEETHLKGSEPIIHTSPEAQKRFHLPRRIPFAYWFDIVSSDSTNRILAQYRLPTNTQGDSILEHHGLPGSFPAVIEYRDGYWFYYFAGDFADNPIPMWTAYFKGVEVFSVLFYGLKGTDRLQFFWMYYRPLITGILEDYLKHQSGTFSAMAPSSRKPLRASGAGGAG